MNRTIAMGTIENPIIFIGMPRSGTTILFEAFASHERLGWFSNYTQKFPSLPSMTFVHRMFGSFQGRKNQRKGLPFYKRVLPEPSEVYNVWERLFGADFLFTFLEGDVPDSRAKGACLSYVSKMLKAQGKSRLAVKLTGPPRIHFLQQIFPSAMFIDVIRDPRAVISSLLAVDFWQKRGLNRPFWDGGLSDEEEQDWNAHNQSPVALAALLYIAVLRHTRREVAASGCQYQRVKYETFVGKPEETMATLMEFAGIGPSAAMTRYLALQDYKDMNYKYKEKLSVQDIDLIEELFQRHLPGNEEYELLFEHQ